LFFVRTSKRKPPLSLSANPGRPSFDDEAYRRRILVQPNRGEGRHMLSRAVFHGKREEDVARLSPLGHEHINMLGRYAFSLPDKIARGELRPLRNQALFDEAA
jgi:hypothetical protein